METTAWRIELTGGWKAELIHAYAGVVDVTPRTRLFSMGPPALWIVERGNAHIEWPDRHHRPIEVCAGQTVLLPERARRISLSDDLRIVSVRFRLSHADGLIANLPSAPHLFQTTPLIRSRSKALAKVLTQGFDTNADRLRLRLRPGMNAAPLSTQIQFHLAWHGCFAQWMQALLRHCVESGLAQELDRPPSPRLQRVLEALLRAAPNSHAGLEAAAADAGISYSTLKRVCRAELGLSPSQWVQNLRLERVVARLRDPEQQIKAIAHDTGFSSAAHFSTWFRQQTQMSPSAYRKQTGSSL